MMLPKKLQEEMPFLSQSQLRAVEDFVIQNSQKVTWEVADVNARTELLK